MTTLRLLADDLTGALDTAAEFVRLTGPVSVYWSGAVPALLPASTAIDSGTRELDLEEARLKVNGLAKSLIGADISYKKVDSLLRGHNHDRIGRLPGERLLPGLHCSASLSLPRSDHSRWGAVS